MLHTFKSDRQPTASAEPDEMALGELLGVLDAAAGQPLVFVRDSRPTAPGYHVTEVKAGQFAALDCGANPEFWTETIVQLWDAGETAASPMTAGKFAGIIRKVSGRTHPAPGKLQAAGPLVGPRKPRRGQRLLRDIQSAALLRLTSPGGEQ